MKKTHIVIVILEKFITFARAKWGGEKPDIAAGIEPHNGTVRDCNRAINKVLNIAPVDTVEYVWGHELND